MLGGAAALGFGAYELSDRLAGLTGGSTGSTGAPSPTSRPGETRAPAGTSSETPSADPTPTPTPTPTFSRRALRRDLERYLAERPGRATISFHERVSGLTFRYRPHLRCFTASCVKMEILMALLLQAQADGRELTETELALAAPMIKMSDNKAATALWHRIGGSAGLARANRRFDLKSTTPALGEYWADTLTSAADQVRLLRELVRGGGALHTTHRRYVLGLMRDVTEEQRWGVSAAARGGDVVALKNGWFPTAYHDNLWVIDSVGRVRGPRRDLLIAVLTDHNPSSAAGIQTVEGIAELVAERLP